MDFADALAQVYCEDPCGVLPNALWKMRSHPGATRAHVERDHHDVAHLELADEHSLFIYWHRDPSRRTFPHEHARGRRLLLLHEDYLHAAPLAHYAHRRPFFRLIHRDLPPEPPALPPGFALREARMPAEAAQVAAVIRRCYDDVHVDAPTVRHWTERAVYQPSLWVWIMHTHTRTPAALGIAELDPDITEGSLEWIQVLPEFRGRGLGMLLVQTLLARLRLMASFVTVSGERDSLSQPERLYRSCGFHGDDVWWVLRSDA